MTLELIVIAKTCACVDLVCVFLKALAVGGTTPDAALHCKHHMGS